ncbi:hypothetical protein FN846DRAFT_908737 [Sphaerosporella brunnea]|uniref:Uncharacterized protein n=1 Tax=Sphaerosporella brunnea TaxID=1250544 RepID=A0A5J5ESV9_9PEZI|nr:hypothetical protein FN846DRAFT_908737 [Sphaerosporella brunnea]
MPSLILLVPSSIQHMPFNAWPLALQSCKEEKFQLARDRFLFEQRVAGDSGSASPTVASRMPPHRKIVAGARHGPRLGVLSPDLRIEVLDDVDEERILVEIRTEGALLEEETGRRRCNVAKQ